MNRPPPFLEALLVPVASIYAVVTRARNAFYDRNLRKPLKSARPVVSIGNITAGGTGKTPITAFLIEQLQKKNIKVGIVTRGYGGNERGPIAVTKGADAESAMRFGDEPTWLAQKFPEVPVVVGGDRVRASEFLVREFLVELILADDAFQHRRLFRELDVVLLDATEPRWHYRSLPLGRMREGFQSLKRAHVVFITKTNLSEPEAVEWLRGKCKLMAPKAIVFEFESHIVGLAPLPPEPFQVIEPASFSQKRVMLVSAIGRPEAFRALFEMDSATKCVHHLAFADHHAYTEADCARIDVAAKEFAADAIVLTEKDAVKLAGRWKFSKPCWVTRLEMRPKEELSELYEIVGRLLL